MISGKRFFLAACIALSSGASLMSQVDELAQCLVSISEKLEDIDVCGAEFRNSMMGNSSVLVLDMFEKKFAELFNENEGAKKELMDVYQKRDASISSVVAYVKDILKLADESKKKKLVEYVKNHAAELSEVITYARTTVEKIVTALTQMRREISAFPSNAGRDKDVLNLKKAVDNALNERYTMWSKMLELIAQTEWKYTVVLELFN